jgi:hypothetical protein
MKRIVNCCVNTYNGCVWYKMVELTERMLRIVRHLKIRAILFFQQKVNAKRFFASLFVASTYYL